MVALTGQLTRVNLAKYSGKIIMTISCFLTYWGESQDDDALFEAYLVGPASFLAEAPEALSVELYAPATATDPLLGGGVSPLIVAQLRFATTGMAEHALGETAVSRALDEFQKLPVSNWYAEIEVMRGQIPLKASGAAGETTAVPVTYLVEYRRPADNEELFIEYYCAKHSPIMSELPEIRRLEIYTPVDWRNPLALARSNNMLMCDCSFDNLDALTAALHSDVRHRLREDYHIFPKFTGRVGHYPMRRVRVRP